MDLLKASLVLESGKTFEGYSFGFEKPVSGEVVFNTGMTGYPQSLTDPSYKGQIIVFTYPLIGNYGVPENGARENIPELFESDKIHATGMVCADYSFYHNHFQSKKSLADWLKQEQVPGITGMDTRTLTRELREKGMMLGKIEIEGKEKQKNFFDPNKENIVEQVSTKTVQEFGKGKKTIALIDCGAKNNIVRSLLKRNARVLKVPWNYALLEKQENFDAIVISNGPGDPVMATKTIETTKKALEAGIPTFGICLGNQILALAAGAKTFKLKYGHRGHNQPCVLEGKNTGYITSQNHGYAVDTKTLPKQWRQWFYNANDLTNEGIIHESKLFMSVQFHPEAEPGPTDTGFLFDYFLKKVEK